MDGVDFTHEIVVVDQSLFSEGFVPAVSELTLARPGQVVVATGSKLGVGDVVEVMRNGCDYVFEKPLDSEHIAGVLPEIKADCEKLREKSREFEVLRRLFADLTHREEDVLNHVLDGVSNKDTAEKLNVSVRTIEARRAKVYHKTKSSSVVELVRKVDRFARLSRIFEGPADRPSAHRKLNMMCPPTFLRTSNRPDLSST